MSSQTPGQTHSQPTHLPHPLNNTKPPYASKPSPRQTGHDTVNSPPAPCTTTATHSSKTQMKDSYLSKYTHNNYTPTSSSNSPNQSSIPLDGHNAATNAKTYSWVSQETSKHTNNHARHFKLFNNKHTHRASTSQQTLIGPSHLQSAPQPTPTTSTISSTITPTTSAQKKPCNPSSRQCHSGVMMPSLPHTVPPQQPLPHTIPLLSPKRTLPPQRPP